ncbi:hypothetical protein [Acidihalobacter ferrooxydans]|uniref:Phage holin family protein n=1 Tax=Acidihalobacter ferrooxydans TaxID=1765967 RepID=A0A1P8UFB0_9GAMM|nr:hypothetical protein [Acidihalobacter ferrooxydans]APZ42481.1 hypothetical protein BW247_04750 [Acidihalobacter ferrooxydans]
MLALFDLLELEGRQFKRHLFRLGLGLWLGGVAASALLVGLLLIIWGIERWISDVLGPVLSLLIAGGILLFIAAGLALWVRRLMR